eukprot:353839-Chlamydomonas_euryale.AAC.19
MVLQSSSPCSSYFRSTLLCRQAQPTALHGTRARASGAARRRSHCHEAQRHGASSAAPWQAHCTYSQVGKAVRLQHRPAGPASSWVPCSPTWTGAQGELPAPGTSVQQHAPCIFLDGLPPFGTCQLVT